ncbi:hypothetical protein BVI434_940015 [Burkholderia vietnamiensis]|nr:hypothetical protein BVI434_940015 [Burkholderia vietnamiensis]
MSVECGVMGGVVETNAAATKARPAASTAPLSP